MRPSNRIKTDVLSWRPVRAVLRWRGFPVAFQAAALAGVLWLVAAGLGVGVGLPADELMILRKTNLATLAVWGLWWPGMILAALLFGRLWCTACPMELVNRLGDAAARRIGWPRARFGKWMAAGWWIVGLYLALQLLVAGLSLHRLPHYTAVMLLVLLGGALATGLAFREPRSFCRAFCPAAALLSVYGRPTPVQLEARDPGTCARCRTKDCVRPEFRHRFDRRSCPSLLRPFRRTPTDGCVLCFQCAKVCPHGNIGFGLAADHAPVRQPAALRPFEAAFVMIALGFVGHETIGEVKRLDAVFHWVPQQLHFMAGGLPFGWFEALWFLVLFPAAAWGLIAAAGYLSGHRGGFRALLLSAATGAAPVVAVAHLAKAAAKVAAWAGYLPLAAADPRGLDTLHGIAAGTVAAPASLADLPLLGWIMLGLVIAVALASWRRAPNSSGYSLRAARAGLAGAAALFTAVLAVWVLPLG